MNRLVIVSNRVPKMNGVAAGGLVVGLKATLEQKGGLWFGWSGKTAGDEPEETAKIVQTSPFMLATTDLTQEEYAGHYEGFSNRALWPLLHGRTDLMRFDPGEFDAYRAVNARFARHLSGLIEQRDLVWVQDYHLMLLGRDLRVVGVEAPLGFFLHVPFPEPEVFRRLRCHRELVDALTAFDVLGFQTPADAQNFRAYVLRYLGGIAVDDGSLLLHGRRIRVGAFPIGIDADGFARLAESAPVLRHIQELGNCFAGKLGVIGADRLDYTKGIGERLRGFERLLETAPEYRRKAFLIQIAAPSRESVPEYLELKRVLEEQSGRINARHGDVDWMPVRFLNQTFDHARLTALYRLSRVGLVTPLRDGMNMVAKEYVAAQDALDPGVLVLSRFAGAAVQMQDALLVDPCDADGVAKALKQALEMPLGERRARWDAMMAGLREQDIHHWRDSFLNALISTRSKKRPVTKRPAPAREAQTFKDELLRLMKPLRAYARTFHRDPARADDLVQETAMKAWANRHGFEEGTNMEAWLFTILRNNYFSELRRTGREVEDVDGAFAAMLVDKPAHEGHMAMLEFQAALAQLPVEQREALILVAAAGFSQEEAAEICGCRLGTIKSRVNRARQRLAALLEPVRPDSMRRPQQNGHWNGAGLGARSGSGAGGAA